MVWVSVFIKKKKITESSYCFLFDIIVTDFFFPVFQEFRKMPELILLELRI